MRDLNSHAPHDLNGETTILVISYNPIFCCVAEFLGGSFREVLHNNRWIQRNANLPAYAGHLLKAGRVTYSRIAQQIWVWFEGLPEDDQWE